MDALIRAGQEALHRGDYAQLCRLWSGSTVFNHMEEEVISAVFQQCHAAAERGEGAEWPLLMQCSIYLDCSDQFDANRETALRTTWEWAQKAIRLAPGNALAHRLAGSACYWMDERPGAIAAYRQSDTLQPQVDLQVRLFEMASRPAGVSFRELPLDLRDEDASNYYRAGVTLGKWLANSDDAADAAYIAALQVALYERCIALYVLCLVHREGNPFNADGHTFAMCCNNLGQLYNAQGRHEEALKLLQQGLEYSEFQYLRQNLRDTYRHLGMVKEAADSSLTLMQHYDLDPALFFDCAQTACSYLNRIGQSEDVLQIIDAADETYQSLPEDMQQECLAIYAKLSVHRAPAASLLGGTPPSAMNEDLLQKALKDSPEDLELHLAYCSLLVNRQAYPEALASYGTLVHQAAAAQDAKVFRNALSARGYLQLYHLNDPLQALQDYNAIEHSGHLDFYTCYYQANCHYVLKDVQATLAAGRRALEQITDAITRDDPQSVAQLHMMLANSHFDAGDFGAAVLAYEASLALDDRADVRENYVLAQQMAQPKKSWLSRLMR
ncbi:tetratricopeptide repeat protein [Xanthomonas sp. WHRI 10064A]|uniref:tetratricopeptide repeat protein n=1 Tax=unclassified Xanthomonas TaxID=2643310 RepID=UPI002B23A1BD|nr:MULTISPECIES: tetratricopeptide repeat protein [unclassified Xanthomonas]MEA9585926.1 tetratricopeptide repeat protein [Xanthomonas sp. WHRI 10064B]MEA9614353.1 tetratricopeptide repeat protein [Xanthomonas sp. WHRI 10064A]